MISFEAKVMISPVTSTPRYNLRYLFLCINVLILVFAVGFARGDCTGYPDSAAAGHRALVPLLDLCTSERLADLQVRSGLRLWFEIDHRSSNFSPDGRLVGLVVKTSAPRVEDPRFESHLRQDFSRVESYQ